MVASDAIGKVCKFKRSYFQKLIYTFDIYLGMGLNLNIRRIIFNTVFKSDGEKIILLNPSAVKQIAGRAGRRNSPYPEGVSKTWHKFYL